MPINSISAITLALLTEYGNQRRLPDLPDGEKPTPGQPAIVWEFEDDTAIPSGGTIADQMRIANQRVKAFKASDDFGITLAHKTSTRRIFPQDGSIFIHFCVMEDEDDIV